MSPRRRLCCPAGRKSRGFLGDARVREFAPAGQARPRAPPVCILGAFLRAGGGLSGGGLPFGRLEKAARPVGRHLEVYKDLNIDVLVAEIGSTTTVVNAFDNINSPAPAFLGQGQAPTSVLDGDVRIGLSQAVESLRRNLGADTLTYGTMLATSSAAGGLRMTVHGLVYDMTVKAAREAALGAGANLHLATAGILQEEDLEDIRDIQPNLILLAGGTDYGERKTVLENAKLLRSLDLNVPVVYAGNVQNHNQVKKIFAGTPFYIAENVYPRLDELNIEPTRRIIHQVFEEHITKAPGMQDVREMVTGSIMPTPGAVMECAKLLYSEIGDLLVLDVGGATTDIHSVTEGSEEIAAIQITPEPMAKRTVEGDLGVFVNAKVVAGQMGLEKLAKELGREAATLFDGYKAIPDTDEQVALTERLAYYAAATARALAQKYGVEMPISEAAYQVLYNGKDPRVAIVELMTRAKKHELEDSWV